MEGADREEETQHGAENGAEHDATHADEEQPTEPGRDGKQPMQTDIPHDVPEGECRLVWPVDLAVDVDAVVALLRYPHHPYPTR